MRRSDRPEAGSFEAGSLEAGCFEAGSLEVDSGRAAGGGTRADDLAARLARLRAGHPSSERPDRRGAPRDDEQWPEPQADDGDPDLAESGEPQVAAGGDQGPGPEPEADQGEADPTEAIPEGTAVSAASRGYRGMPGADWLLADGAAADSTSASRGTYQPWFAGESGEPWFAVRAEGQDGQLEPPVG